MKRIFLRLTLSLPFLLRRMNHSHLLKLMALMRKDWDPLFSGSKWHFSLPFINRKLFFYLSAHFYFISWRQSFVSTIKKYMYIHKQYEKCLSEWQHVFKRYDIFYYIQYHQYEFLWTSITIFKPISPIETDNEWTCLMWK